MKKLMAVLFALLMVFTVVGCGKKEETTTTEKTTIVFAAQADTTPATKDQIDAFNASQDKYEVKFVEMTNDSGAMKEQLITSMKAGSSEYDVLSMDVCWAGEFAAAGYIDPIDQSMKDAGLKASDFNAGSMAAASYNAKTYALPFFPDLGILFFRTDIVSSEDAAKLVAGDYTYAELQAMAEKYKGQGGTKDGIGFQGKLGECLCCNLTEYTYGWTDIEGGLVAMKAMVDSDAVPADILNWAEGETCTSFEKGETVFSRNWPYQWGDIQNNGTISTDVVGVAPLPGGSTVGGWLLGINKNSANKEGAWEFIKFLATDGCIYRATEGGQLPGYNAKLTDKDALAANEMLSMDGFKAALATTVSRPVSAEYTKCSDAIVKAAHAYLSGDAELAATVSAVEAALAE